MATELDTIDHVLRGSLNAALLNAQLLSASLARGEGLGPLIDRIQAEIRRLAEDLLPAAMHIMSLEAKDVRRVDVRQVVARALEAAPLHAAVVAPGARVEVMGDGDLLEVAVAHLVRNAVAATPEGAASPTLSVDLQPGGLAEIRVTNRCTGPGPSLAAGRVPERRGHVGGLAAALRIARLHGGSLTYEVADSMVTARLSLPAVLRGHGPGRDARPHVARSAGGQQGIGQR